jgi:heat shock protein HtpX
VSRRGDKVPRAGIASGIGDADYGRIGLAFVAVLVLVPLIAGLVIFYVSEYGALPFTFRPGPYGITPWEPAAVLLIALIVLVVAPLLMHRFAPAGDTFWSQGSVNRRDSLLLSAAIVVLLALTAYVIAAVVSLRTSVGLAFAGGAVAVGAASAWLAYTRGERALLRMSSARPLGAGDGGPIHDVVRELAVAANIPAPALYVVEENAPNAFAAGRDPEHAVLVVTRGLLGVMSREELQGVVAHEVAHIRNYDSRYSLIVAIGVGAVVLVADGFFRVVTLPFRIPRLIADAAGGGGSGGSWGFGSWGGGSSSSSGGGGGGGGGGGSSDGGGDSDAGDAFAIILAIIIFVFVLLLVATVLNAIAPLFARLTQVAVSRNREYLADATAVELGRNPAALEEALLRAARTDQVLVAANRATAPLWFVNPIRFHEKRASGIFSTHPRTIDRVNRLRELRGVAPLADDGSIQEDVD